jgi:hypothetical protein
MGCHTSVALHHRFGILTHKDSKRLRGERMLTPPTGSHPLLRWVRGATVGTLRTGYPRVQASSQDNGSRFPAGGSSEAAMCLHSSGSFSQHGAAPGPSRVPAARAPAPSTEQLWRWHVSAWLRLPLPARGSSGAATCPRALRAAVK